MYMGGKETPKSSDHPGARRSLAISCASSHGLIPAAQFLGWTNLKKNISLDKQHVYLWFCLLCTVPHRTILSQSQASTSENYHWIAQKTGISQSSA